MKPVKEPNGLNVGIASQNIVAAFDRFKATGRVHKILEQCLLFLAEKAESAEGLEKKVNTLEAEIAELKKKQ